MTLKLWGTDPPPLTPLSPLPSPLSPVRGAVRGYSSLLPRRGGKGRYHSPLPTPHSPGQGGEGWYHSPLPTPRGWG